jgi:competence protein ComEC
MIRRPLTAAAVSYGAGIACQHLMNDSLSCTVIICAGALLLCLFFYYAFSWNIIENITIYGTEKQQSQRMKKAVEICLVFFIFGAVSGHISENRTSQFDDVYGKTVTIAGRISSVEVKKDDRCSLVMTAVQYDDGKTINERVRITVNNIDGAAAAALTGHFGVVSGTVSKPDTASNPGAFDYSMYLRSQKIYSTMYVDSAQFQVSTVKPKGWYRLMNYISVFKYDYEQRLISALDDESAEMLAGILFGDDSLMDDETKESFQKNGIAHLLAASGLHVGFVYGLVNVLMRKPKTVAGNIPVILILVMYAALAGFSPSVVRAVFMIIVYIVGKVKHRRYDFLTCTSFCALVLLIYEPANLFASGFQLSFMAVFTLSIVMKRVEGLTAGMYKAMGDKRAVIAKPVIGTLTGMAALQLGMMPLTVYHFHYVSLGGFFLNIPAIALAGIIVPLGIILMPLAYIGGVAFMFMGNMEEMLVRLLLFMNKLLYGTPLSFRYTASPSTFVFILYYLMLFFICSESGWRLMKILRQRESRRLCAVTLSVAVLVSAAFGFVADADYIMSDLIFVDVGQGDCAHLKAGRNTDILFDSGGSEKKDVGADILSPYLLGNGVSDIDMAVISHMHTDHYAGLLTLKDSVKIKKVMLSAVYESHAENISEETGVPVEDLLFVKAGDVVSAGGVSLEVLAPQPGTAEEYRRLLEDGEDENKLSLIVKASYKGRTVLFTGDMDSEYEQQLTDIYHSSLKSDILKVAHHGSKYSSCEEFLDSVKPSVSVIQVGTNLYGHPTPEALERLKASGSMIFRNDSQGAVMVRLGRKIKIRTMK